MDKDKKSVNLSWDAFQSMGNPENAPEIVEKEDAAAATPKSIHTVRVYLERKKRGGKTVTVIKGIDESEEELNALTKVLKSSLGVGGACKDGEIVLQGDKRLKVVDLLKSKGYSNTKNAGA